MISDTMYIGSGDIHALMSGMQTKSHAQLLQRFVSGVKPYYNAFASPIDALRTGAILENRFLLTLSDDWFSQHVVVSEEMDVFKCSLDFARLWDGKVTEFIELKTLSFGDFLENIEPIKEDNPALLSFLKKKHKSYYNQVQEQLYCTGLSAGCLVFLAVESYDDEENLNRNIEEREYCRITVPRDEEAIGRIKERGRIFQTIKDYYANN